MRLVLASHKLPEIRTNLATPVQEIEDFLAKSWKWIEKNLAHIQNVETFFPLCQGRSGDRILFDGEIRQIEYQVTLLPTGFVSLSSKKLDVYIPLPLWRDRDFVGVKLLKDWVEAQAISIMSSRIQHLLQCRGLLRPSEVKWAWRKSSWGLCDRRGVITLNYQLIALPSWVRDYVIVHELVHLLFFNHSKLFWTFVRDIYPQVDEAKKWLRCVSARLMEFKV